MPSLPAESSAVPQRRNSSYAWMYPLNGIVYFANNRFLWPLLRARLFPAIILSTIVLVSLFVWTYLPQALFLRIFHSHGAWLNAAILVLGEGAAITALLFEAFLVDEAQVDVFDSILVAHGHDRLVALSRPVEPAGPATTGAPTPPALARNPRARLGRPTTSAIYGPFSLRQILEFVLLLPLNLVPWIGVPLFLWLTGWRAGPLHHHRYFKLRELQKADRRAFVKQRRLGYTGFGMVALVLQLVPVLSMVFLLTSAAGSALWACRLEAEAQMDEAAAGARPAVAGEEPPPYAEYVDNPV